MAVAACGGNGSTSNGDPTGQCAEVIRSDITVARTLTDHATGCDYLVEGELRVHGALTIEAGTEVRFAQDARLTFSNAGSLSAVGTAERRVLLRGSANQHGHWNGLCFGDAGPSRIEHVNLMNAGKVVTGGSLVCRGGIGSVGNFTSQPVSIVDSHVSGAVTSGLDAARLPLGQFARNVFSDNHQYGVRVSAAYASHLDAASDYSGQSVGAPNGRPYVYLSGTLNQPGSTHTWLNLNVPYLTGGDESPYGTYVSIDNDSHVEVQPGTTFLFGAGGGITVDRGSSLLADGEHGKITFAGVNPAPGSWLGLLSRSASLLLAFVEVSWGGGERIQGSGNIVITGAGPAQQNIVGYSLIRGSASCGLYATLTAAEQLINEGNEYTANRVDECLP